MPLQVQDYLNCPICRREFGQPVQPVSLSCGHTACRSCLRQTNKLECPFDQSPIDLALDAVPCNMALLQLTGMPMPESTVLPPSILALSLAEQEAYLKCTKVMETMATYLRYKNDGHDGISLSRPMIRKIMTLVQIGIIFQDGRVRAVRAARSLGERMVTELLIQHQNPMQLGNNLWAAVRARGCQFLGPNLQEEVLRLIFLALEDGTALSRKVLVMFVVQRLEQLFPSVSKTSVGHVVQLLYRASCFMVSKRSSNSSLMQLKKEFRTYEFLRLEHDIQLVHIAVEAGLRIPPDQWSLLLYGDSSKKSHMQSILDKHITIQTFAGTTSDLMAALKRTGDPAKLSALESHLETLYKIDPLCEKGHPSWKELEAVLTSLLYLVTEMIQFIFQHIRTRDNNHNHMDTVPVAQTPEQATEGERPTPHRYKTAKCWDYQERGFCPRGDACRFAHGADELRRLINRDGLRPIIQERRLTQMAAHLPTMNEVTQPRMPWNSMARNTLVESSHTISEYATVGPRSSSVTPMSQMHPNAIPSYINQYMGQEFHRPAGRVPPRPLASSLRTGTSSGQNPPASIAVGPRPAPAAGPQPALSAAAGLASYADAAVARGYPGPVGGQMDFAAAVRRNPPTQDFVRSDSILLDDDCVPYEAPSEPPASHYGPIGLFNPNQYDYRMHGPYLGDDNASDNYSMLQYRPPSDSMGGPSNHLGEHTNNLGEMSGDLDGPSNHICELANNMCELANNMGELANNMSELSNGDSEFAGYDEPHCSYSQAASIEEPKLYSVIFSDDSSDVAENSYDVQNNVNLSVPDPRADDEGISNSEQAELAPGNSTEDRMKRLLAQIWMKNHE